MSAFTATGATVLSGLDALPLSVNVWRCFMMLVGGLGIIVLAVAILPLLGVGGSAAVQGRDGRPDEGPEAHAAHRRDGARPVGRCTSGSALACFGAYRWAGMSWADAFMHMCTTMGLGGFSSHDASFGTGTRR
jgi:trk system potassium uptake protein TrkH